MTDIEILGFGGDFALDAQVEYRRIKEKERMKARKVNKEQLLGDGEIANQLLGKNLAHRE